jgi:rhodanese-related sulfurtransferase
MKLLKCLFFAAAILFLSPKSHAQKTKARIEILDNAAFEAKLLHIKGSLIDLRSASEAESGVIPNARIVEWEGDSFKKIAKELPRNQPVFLYCGGGYRSKEAAEWMNNEGFTTIIILKDGFDLWLSEGYTVTDRTGKIIQEKKSNRNKKPSTTYD